MKLLAVTCLVLAFAAPAFAQEAPKTDWTKPQILDGPPSGGHQPAIREDVALPVEVYTVEDLRASGSPAAGDFARSLEQPATSPEKSSPAQKETVSPDDPLANYSPEMREKLRRFLPKPKEE